MISSAWACLKTDNVIGGFRRAGILAAILPAPVDAPVVGWRLAVEDESSADDAPLVIAADDLMRIK
jgi:hypothetical protein